MVAPALPAVTLYGRPGCHLCEEALVTLRALLDQRATERLPTTTVVERDIDTDPVAHDAYFETIPVVEFGVHRLELATSPAKLRRFLADALDGPEATR